MIQATLMDLFFDLLTGLFYGLEFVNLPYQYISSLGTILSYGTWIVGLDVLGLFVSMIVGWWTIKLTVGLVLFVWDLLPLT